jgi:F-type H+-transporting ATPase subunit b
MFCVGFLLSVAVPAAFAGQAYGRLIALFSPRQAAHSGIKPEIPKLLAAEASAAAGEPAQEADDSQEQMERELKFSPSVVWLSKLLHLSPVLGYWASLLLDFCLLVLLAGWALKKYLPVLFRKRTQSIRREIEEAGKTSAEAQRRLAGIEARLTRLDSEVEAMRAAAEQEAAAEDKRMMAAAAEDTRRIVQAAETEISSLARQAQRELKAFAADLAVTLAEARLHVDDTTDQALIRSFTGRLGAENEKAASGKDGQ